MKNHTKIIKTYPEGIYREENGKKIFGKSILIYINNGQFFLTNLKIYEDGLIDCWNGLVNFEEFKQKVSAGWIKTSIPENSRINIHNLGHFKAIGYNAMLEENELIKEVRDIINKLNDKPTTSEICYKLFNKYNENPTEENKMKLKKAYEDIPKHNRVYVLGDMDSKDGPIKQIIYNENN